MRSNWRLKSIWWIIVINLLISPTHEHSRLELDDIIAAHLGRRPHIPADDHEHAELELDDIIAGHYQPLPNNATWHSDDLLYRNADGDLCLYDTANLESQVLMLANTSGLRTSYTQQLSADRRFVMLEQRQYSVHQYSRRSHYHMYELIDDSSPQPFLHPVSVYGSIDVLVDYAIFGPVGTVVYFVQENNLYYFEVGPQSADWLPSEIRTIAASGGSSRFNGLLDYSFETEIFRATGALWPSPDGHKLAYLRIDEDQVPGVQFSRYKSPTADEKVRMVINYPSSKTKSPTSLLFVYDLKASPNATIEESHVQIPYPVGSSPKFYMVTDVCWTPTNELVMMFMNHGQRRAYVQTCVWDKMGVLKCDRFVRLERMTGWLPLQPALYNPTTKMAAIVRRVRHSRQLPLMGEVFYQQVVLTPSVPTGKQLESHLVPLNEGTFNAERIVHWDQQQNWIFYLGNTHNETQHRHLYAVQTELGIRSAQCVTCAGLTYNDHGKALIVHYDHFDVDFNRCGNQLLMLHSQGPFVPRHDIFRWQVLRAADNRDAKIYLNHVLTLQTNEEIRQRVQRLQLPQIVYVQYPLFADETPEFTARVRLQLPPQFDQKAYERSRLAGGVSRSAWSPRYPLLVHEGHRAPDQYTGTSEWRLDWMSYMVVRHNVVVAEIDATGSARQTVDGMSAVFGRLGDREVLEYPVIVEHLADRWTVIDRSLWGMWGTGYGGYVTGRVLAAHNHTNQLRCAALVQPINDWRVYNAFYTQRYMNYRDEVQHTNSYNMYSLFEFARDWRDKQILLVHARQADPVDWYMTRDLAEIMQVDGVHFEYVVYPNMNEERMAKRKHFHRRLKEFFHRCLVDYCYYGK